MPSIFLNLPIMREKPSILILNTGGTIGMVLDEKTGALKPVNFDDLFDLIPTLRLFNFNIDHFCFDPLIDSSNMNPTTWASIAKVIEEKYELYDGFVILHGSDTMAFTASALSFMLQNLNKLYAVQPGEDQRRMVRYGLRESYQADHYRKGTG